MLSSPAPPGTGGAISTKGTDFFGAVCADSALGERVDSSRRETSALSQAVTTAGETCYTYMPKIATCRYIQAEHIIHTSQL